MKDNLLEDNTFWLRGVHHCYSQQVGLHENSRTHSIVLGRHDHWIQIFRLYLASAASEMRYGISLWPTW